MVLKISTETENCDRHEISGVDHHKCRIYKGNGRGLVLCLLNLLPYFKYGKSAEEGGREWGLQLNWGGRGWGGPFHLLPAVEEGWPVSFSCLKDLKQSVASGPRRQLVLLAFIWERQNQIFPVDHLRGPASERPSTGPQRIWESAPQEKDSALDFSQLRKHQGIQLCSNHPLPHISNLLCDPIRVKTVASKWQKMYTRRRGRIYPQLPFWTEGSLLPPALAGKEEKPPPLNAPHGALVTMLVLAWAG